MPVPDPTAGSSCPGCGRFLAGGSGESACPQCLLGVALDSTPGGNNDETSWLDSLQENRARADRYEILAEIARGGMGVVYRARDRGLNRTVALKMILPQQLQSTAAIQRFQSEAEAVAALDHPGILPIYEVGELDGLPFFSMKLALGGSLANQLTSYVDRPREAARLIAHVARAIHHAHERGILHRDLKPGNILLGREGEAYVTDFGIAKWVARESNLTLDASTLGTPHYISPEQATGGSAKLTAAADVYSLGAILYEMVAGRPPFVAETALETLRLVADAAPPSPRTFNPAIPSELEIICLKCLEKKPAARYSSGAELAQDLEHWLEGETITARSTTSAERAWRWTKRNRVVTALSGGLLLALLTLVVAWLFLQRKPATPLTLEAPAKSIAVLPFENLSDDKQNAFFADGVQDEVLTDLAKIGDLKVISRTSVMSYPSGVRRNLREIAQRLGVAYVLEGSVQRANNRIRINAQLVDARTDAHVWANTYDRDLADVFAIQSEIAKAIADQLQAKLSPKEKAAIEEQPTADLRAYECYLKSKELLGGLVSSADPRGKILQAVDLLQEATKRDPHFLQAYFKLAGAHEDAYTYQVDRTPERLAQAREAVDALVRLRPEAPETHLAQASYAYIAEHDYSRARGELTKGLAALPNNADALTMAARIDRRQGRWDDCLQMYLKAKEIDPGSTEILRDIANIYLSMRRYTESELWINDTLGKLPDAVGLYHYQLGVIYFAEGQLERAKTEFAQMPSSYDPFGYGTMNKVMTAVYLRDYDSATQYLAAGPSLLPDNSQDRSRCPRSWLAAQITRAQKGPAESKAAFASVRGEVIALWKDTLEEPGHLTVLARIDAALGRKDEAIREARHAVELRPISEDALEGPRHARNLALVYALLGERNAALEELEKLARIHGGPSYGDLKFDPQWDDLRGDPRFQNILTAIKPSSTSQTQAAPEKSIAVLPFENRSDDKQNAYFVDGVQDEILTHLAKIADLKVIGRTSVMAYTSGVRRNLREIGQQLGVAHVLEGSVQREGGKVRVNAQLINALTGVHEWAENYDRPVDDVFAIQSEIAKKIADQLQAKISPREKIAMSRIPTSDLMASELYVQAKEFLHSAGNDPNGKQGLLEAVRLLDEAIARDPRFLVAYCVLARMHLELYWEGFDHTAARLELANAAIQKASRLEADAGEVHLAQADYAYHGFRDYDRARAELDRARELLPNDVDVLDLTALIDRRQGRWAEAMRNLERAAELDPLNFGLLSDAATTATTSRRYPEAARLFERALKISPRDYAMRTRRALMLCGEQGDVQPLRDFVSDVLKEDAPAVNKIAFGLFYLALLERDSGGMPRALAAISPAGMQMLPGDFSLPQEYYAGLAGHAFNDPATTRRSFTEARAIVEKIVREQPDYAPAWSALGLIDAGLGRKEEAASEGRRACELLPLSRDAVSAPAFITSLAVVYAWTGEKDLALEQLAVSAGIPNGVTYGDLKLNPQWDALRGEPRFKKILAKIAPATNSPNPAVPEKNIAVLPFIDLSQAKDQEYFCDGISEELLDKLAKVEGLHVVSRTSSFFFKGKNADLAEVARRLNVQSVLEGSVRRDGNRVRITAQLVNVQDGRQLWSETYEREVQDIFAVQDNITKAIVEALKVKLATSLPSQKQHDPEAYDLYLRGLYFSNKSSEEDLRKALSFFQRALDKDPNFARAWTGIAKVWNWLADEYVKPLDAYPISRAAALKAIALDEREAEAHVWLGEAERVLYWDYRKEESDLRHAIEIDSNCAAAHVQLALLLAANGPNDEEFAELAIAKRLDPLLPIISNFIVELNLSANRLDEAVAEGQRMAELDPTFSYYDDSLAAAYRERGELAKSIDIYEKAEAVTHVPRPGLAIAYARSGRIDDARRVLAQLIERSKTHYAAADGIASIYVALGDKDEAFRWLDRAIDEHSAPLEGIAQRITFRSLHSDPRFAEILRRIHLDPAKVLAPR